MLHHLIRTIKSSIAFAFAKFCLWKQNTILGLGDSFQLNFPAVCHIDTHCIGPWNVVTVHLARDVSDIRGPT